MKKILFFLLLLSLPLFVGAKTWFIANAVRFEVEDEWEKCHIQVSIDNDWKINIYAQTHLTIRKIKELGMFDDDEGNNHVLWGGIDQNGTECIVALTKFKNTPYLRLTITFESENFAVYYMLMPDN